jgi:DNA-binding transcriptional LysR family regulator
MLPHAMDKLRALQYLVKVADLSSFSQAAQAYGVPASSVSRRIADLEQQLGTQLLYRTTRAVRLTDAGADYVEQVRSGLSQLHDADESVAPRGHAPRGRLRISAMPGYGQMLLLPALQGFSERYPEVVLDVHLDDTVVDLGRDQIDIAVRGGRQPQERVVAHKLDANRFVLAATPAYLARHGMPRTLADLAQHRALMYRGPRKVIPWQGRDADGWRELPMVPAFVSNDGAALIAAALRGAGLLLLAEWALRPWFQRGELVPIETEQPVSATRDAEAGVYLLVLQSRLRVPKVRVAVDHLVGQLGGR